MTWMSASKDLGAMVKNSPDATFPHIQSNPVLVTAYTVLALEQVHRAMK